MNVFNSHRGSISALFKIKKRLLGKDLKLSASFPIHCSSTVLYQQFISSLLLLPSPRFLPFCFWIPLVPLWCHCANLINHKGVFEMLLNTTIYRPLLLCINTVQFAKTEQQFAQNDPPPLAHCSPSILQSFLRPKYCGSKLTLAALTRTQPSTHHHPLQLRL